MTNEIENEKGQSVQAQGGFLQIIILIVIALLIMKYLGVTVSGVIYWFQSFFSNVLR